MSYLNAMQPAAVPSRYALLSARSLEACMLVSFLFSLRRTTRPQKATFRQLELTHAFTIPVRSPSIVILVVSHYNALDNLEPYHLLCVH